jgi:Lon protease-like protein
LYGVFAPAELYRYVRIVRLKMSGAFVLPLMTIPLFPLSQPLFPDSLMPLRIFEVRYLHMIKRCKKEGTPFGIVALRQGNETQQPGVQESMHSIGCLAHIIDVTQVQAGLLFIRCKGGQRFRLHGSERGALGLWHGQVDLIDEDMVVDIPPDLEAIANQLGALIADAQKKGIEAQLPITRPYRLDECGWVANQWANLLSLTPAQKISLLSDDDPLSRLTQIKLILN